MVEISRTSECLARCHKVVKDLSPRGSPRISTRSRLRLARFTLVSPRPRQHRCRIQIFRHCSCDGSLCRSGTTTVACMGIPQARRVTTPRCLPFTSSHRAPRVDLVCLTVKLKVYKASSTASSSLMRAGHLRLQSSYHLVSPRHPIDGSMEWGRRP